MKTMRWLNYQHLYYFWHVAKAGSVTVAARQLKLAQPTVSAQLKAFEHVLGEKLLERHGRGIKLTETGHLAFRYAEQIFALGQEFIDTLDGKAVPASRELRIGIADVVPKILAFKLIEPAFERPDETVVVCSEDKTERLLGELAIGEIDLVVADRPIPPSVKVKAFNHFIGESPLSFLGVKSLARRFRPGFPKSLAEAPLLLPTAESAVRGELDRWFESIGVTPRTHGVFQDRALMKLAAREGRGLLAVPSSIEREVAAEFGLEAVGRVAEVREQLYLISTERRLKNPLVARLCAEGQRRLTAVKRSPSK
ncbi:MAG: hypothetical protein RL417_1624 [Pseudomonadota bacterium]